MKLKELLRENRENIESLTITNDLITYFSSDIKVLDLIEGEDKRYKLILNEIVIKLDEFQAEQDSYFNTDKIYYFDLMDCKLDLKLR
ncbi:MAG: hypothetical protein Q4P79_06515 [Fusobacterium sp.]|nr:hypothetical protein [Fusobacterium sp.]MDO5789101.1 hypothetical protein [Fusobacterium sp.]